MIIMYTIDISIKGAIMDNHLSSMDNQKLLNYKNEINLKYKSVIKRNLKCQCQDEICIDDEVHYRSILIDINNEEIKRNLVKGKSKNKNRKEKV